ncbi:MAG: S1 RNA-binding domain-containing protein [Anaerolineales bacterium]|nr:S1 RNA-binding domain-containing protein [Anaerolineales bacterium]MCB9129087.1 S1 RNA-binding domain-containing protein [Ardenticatenales bacterium]MCB9172761.1 S1 RNA-binding domain-containing protein [Ardenticatenales bacterium]
MVDQQENYNDAQMFMLEWLDAHDEEREQLYSGQITDGTVMHVGEDEILVDVGAKAEGVVDGRELNELTEAQREALVEGAVIRVYVVRVENEHGNPQLSISRAKMEQDWEEVEANLADDNIFEAEVTGSNKGGLIVHIGQLRGFVPSSQVFSVRGQAAPGQTHQDRLASLIGETLNFKVLEVDRRQNRLILSERAAEQERRKALKAQLLDEIEEGQTLSGVVSSLAPFGAFVDLGGADGLVHISELSWGRINHPSEVVQVGDEVDVYVLNVDLDRRRIGLSLKKLQPEPWDAFMSAYKEGDDVAVTITNLADFGAFARVKSHPIEGLIHISELSSAHIAHPREVVSSGEEVMARILRMEPERQRLGLTLRHLETSQDDEMAAPEAAFDEDDDGEGATNSADFDEIEASQDDALPSDFEAEDEGEREAESF